jgi:hypothetical protein
MLRPISPVRFDALNWMNALTLMMASPWAPSVAVTDGDPARAA